MNKVVIRPRRLKKGTAILKLWPIENLNNLSIEDYHQAKTQIALLLRLTVLTQPKDPTFANYFDIWEPISLGKDDKYYNEKPYSWHKRLGIMQS